MIGSPALVTLIALTGAGPAPGAGASLAPGDTLAIWFTAETHGKLEPCACKDRPLGGLARRVGTLALAAAGPVLRLDGGGFLPSGDVPLRDDPEVATRFTRLIVASLARSGYDAVAVQPRERAFLRRVAPSEFAEIEASLQDPGAAGIRTFQWGSRGVALLLVDRTMSLEVIEAAAHAARERAAAEGQSGQPSLLLVLSRADPVNAREIARVSGADLLIVAEGARPPDPIREGKSVLWGCGIDGREVGRVRIAKTGDGFRVVDAERVPMDETAPADPETAERVDALLLRDGVSIRAYVSQAE